MDCKLESIRRRSYRYLALEEVLIKHEEQYLLSGNGSDDDEAIADAYYSVSNECQFRAEQTAIQDRKEIEYYIMYDNDDSDNDSNNDDDCNDDDDCDDCDDDGD